MAYAIGHVSGCHPNPAVTVGLAVGGRFPAGQIAYYAVAQARRHRCRRIAVRDCERRGRLRLSQGFASNGYGAHSPGKYRLLSCFLTEVTMTLMFLAIIMGSTHGKAPVGFRGVAIGLALVMMHLVSIPVTNTSVNPARSTAPAFFVGGWAMAQLWLFWVAPLIGGVWWPDLSLGERGASRCCRGDKACIILSCVLRKLPGNITARLSA